MPIPKMKPAQLVHAAYQCGRGGTINEVSVNLKVNERTVRDNLFRYNIRFDDTPFGYRGLRVRVSPTHIRRLQKAAEARGYLGDGGVERILENLVRAVMSHQTTLDAVLDDGSETPL
jgi:hypothetical protein